MSYKSKRSNTLIKNNGSEGIMLSIETLGRLKWASLLVTTPSGKNSVRHHHFELTREEIKAMNEWFKAYLKDDRFKPKKTVDKKTKSKVRKKHITIVIR